VTRIDADGCTFLRNTAIGGHGGAVSLSLDCVAMMRNCVFESNTAVAEECGPAGWDQCGGGGAVSMQGNARLIVTGHSRLIGNMAQGDSSKSSGGAILAWGNSEVTLQGTRFISNRAIDAKGGAIAALQDSRIDCAGVSFSNNTAVGQGGAVFVGSATFRSTSAPVIFRGETVFEDNVVIEEDGGAIFTNRHIEFAAGGFSALRRNFAGKRGGAVTLTQCDLVVRFGHEIEASFNEAGLHGGALALLSGATVILSNEECSSLCDPTKKSDGTCNPECMNRACNWDGGDCLPILEAAGTDAKSPCNRRECGLLQQTEIDTVSFGCSSKCFTASCDWSQHLCQNIREAIEQCPLLDSSAYTSILLAQQQDGAPVFLKGGISDDFGRCANGNMCMQPDMPPGMSVLLDRPGKLGPSALRLSGRTGGWLHAELGKRKMQGSDGFTVEMWIKPETSSGWQSAAMSGTPYGSLGYILAGQNFAFALRMVSSGDFTPMVFMVGPAPKISCASETVLTASTSAIGDGPGATPRSAKQGYLTCTWIIAPTNASSVTLVFTEFKFYQAPETIAQYITIDVCSDATCGTIQHSSPQLVGGHLPPPFTSSTGVMKVTLYNHAGNRLTGRGFQATYAASSRVQLTADMWQHLAVSISADGFGRLYVNQAEVWSMQLDWNPELAPPFDGEYGTAIGRRSADWQDTYNDNGNLASSYPVHQHDDEGFFHGLIDELRVWKSTRSISLLEDGKDWSCSYWPDDPNLVSCFNFDQTISQNRYIPDQATVDDAASYAHPAPGNTPHLPFCVNIDNEGLLYNDDEAGHATVEDWGFCSEDKPRLPGAAYNYNIDDMQLASERREQGTAAVLKHYRGCGEVSLNFTRNVAGRNGGAVFYDSCQGLNDGRYCFLQLSSERAIFFHYNVAGSAGGSVYIECSSIGLVCDLSFGAYNKIGALTSLPKAEFRGSSAEFYGDNVATKARRMSWEDQETFARVTCSNNSLCSLCADESESQVTNGTITDGISNYPSSQHCQWIIAADTEITIIFRLFDLESSYDFMTISSCETEDCSLKQQIGRLSGKFLQRTEFTSATGFLEVVFTSDADVSEAGFIVDWKLSPDRSWQERTLGPIIPGQDTVSFLVKLYDDLSTLVRGSDDLIEVIICPPIGACGGRNTLVPPQYYPFDKVTGICRVDNPFECPVGSDEVGFEVHLLGSIGVPMLRGQILCSKCRGGQSRTNTVAQNQLADTWNCKECANMEYVVDPNNATHRCYPCPLGALCASPEMMAHNMSADSVVPFPDVIEIRPGEIW